MYESFRELSVQCICSFIDLFVGFAVQFFETFMYSNFSHTAGQISPSSHGCLFTPAIFSFDVQDLCHQAQYLLSALPIVP